MTAQAAAQRGKGFKPTYAALAAAYPGPTVLQAQLYTEMGFEALIGLRAYENTCAIRMSYGVTKTGVMLRRGGLRINKGPHKNKRIEPGMKKFAEQLVELWGAPEKYKTGDDAKKGIAGRKGVVAFFFGEFLPLVAAQGHVDLVNASKAGMLECAGACYFSPDRAVWFWPLD